MGKLFNLKSWMTLAESASHLTAVFSEPVNVADVLRLALDERLRLSVVFVKFPTVKFCKPVNYAQVKYEEVPTLDGLHKIKLPIGGQVVVTSDYGTRQVQDEIEFLIEDQAYDLAMIGGSKNEIERRYWELVGGQYEESTSLRGTFVLDGPHLYQLQDRLPRKPGKPTEYYPSGSLPETSMIVVRTSELLALESRVSEVDLGEKPLVGKERSNLYNLVGVLLAMLDSKGHDEADVKRFIVEQGYSDMPGLSKRQLEKVFPLVRKSMN